MIDGGFTPQATDYFLRGNRVEVKEGPLKGIIGEVIQIDRKNNRAKVKGINLVKKHIKTTKEKKGGIFSQEDFLHMSNLLIMDDKKKIKKTEAKKWHRD